MGTSVTPWVGRCGGLVITSLVCLLMPTATAASVQAMQPVEPLMEAARALIEAQASHYPGQVSVHIDTPRLNPQPACTDLSFDLMGSGALQSRTTVRARCRTPQPWTLYLRAEVRLPGTYFVTNRRIRRGEALSLDDLDTREGDLLRHSSYVSDPSLIIDWIATRPMGPGAAIESGALRHPDSIERGQPVQTRISGPGFTITGTGHAVESGNPGSVIQVRTPHGKIIMGTVVNTQWVHVPL
ncbi:flagellar basal body P-ring formation chaperone FlgA [Castellaniella sp.]|uniref:flagellar basal body P-ring formation chaperone FlgA n=1 Tax=Castellaniella sp. TaxID=1955812 RepID=UPI003568A156